MSEVAAVKFHAITKEIGKIQRIRVGMGGYQDAMIGFSFALGGPGWGVGDFWGQWATRPDGAKWSEADRLTELGKVFLRVGKLLHDANVETVDALTNKPIEVTFQDGVLESWRILTEAI